MPRNPGFAALLLAASAAAAASAQTLSVLSGDGQITTQNFITNYPLVVVATNAAGQPAPGVTVNWSLSGPGTLVPGGKMVTDSNGQASTTFVGATIYGDTAFTQSTVTASAGSGSVTMHVTTSGEDFSSGNVFVQAEITEPPLGQVISGPGQIVQTYVFAVHNAGVQLVPNVSMRLIPENPSGPSVACAQGTGVTDQTGVGKCQVVFSGPPGSGFFDIEVGGFRTFSGFQFTSTGGSSTPTPQGETISIVGGNNQSGTPGSQLPAPLTARVQNSSGAPLPNVAVVWQPNAGVTLSNVVSASDANGMISASVTLGSSIGPTQVQVHTADGAAQAVFSLTVTQTPVTTGPTGHGSPSAIRVVNGNNQSGSPGAALPTPLTAQVVDSSGAPVPNVAVVWQSESTASLSNVVSTSDANGMVSATVTLGFTGGVEQVLVQTGSSSGGFQTPFGPTAGALIQATFSLNVTQSSISTPSQGRPSAIRIIGGNNQSGTPGTRLPAALQAQIVDGSGNPIPNIAVTWLPGPSVFLTNAVSASDANGYVNAIATLGSAPGATQVQVQAGTPGVATPFGTTNGSFVVAVFNLVVNLAPVIVQPPQPAGIQIVAGNNQSGAPGARLPASLTARVVDASGNPVANAPVIWQALGPQFVALSGVVSTSDANGLVSAVATLGLSLGPAQVQLRLASTGVQVMFNLQAALTLSGMSLVSGSNQTTTTGSSFPQTVTVQLFTVEGPAGGLSVQVTPSGAPVVLPNGGTATSDSGGFINVPIQAGQSPGVAIVTISSGQFSTAAYLVIQAPQPMINPAAFYNAASNQPGPISPTGILSVYAAGLAPGLTGCVTPNLVLGPLPMSLSGVQVQFSSDGYSAFAPIYSVCNFGAGQQYAVVETPADLPLASVNVTVQAGGSSIAASTVVTSAAGPGIFETQMSDGAPRAVLQRPDGSYVSLENPAQPGEQLSAFVTGLGRPVTNSGIAINTNQAGISGDDAPPPNPVTIAVGGEVVPLISGVYSQSQIGVYVLTFDVPADAPAGNDISFTITTTVGGANIAANPSKIPVE